MGKYAKETLHEKENLATEILERIHSDVCGPFSTASISKHMYYVIFLVIFLESVGSTSCRRKIRCSQNFVSAKHWLRKIQGSM